MSQVAPQASAAQQQMSPQMLLAAVAAMSNACCDGGCVEVHPDGRILRVVGGAAFGHPADQLGGVCLWELSFPDDRQPLMQTL